MHPYPALGNLLAATSKHHIAGIVAIVIGAILIVLGALRVLGRAAIGAVVPLIGAVIVVLGILLFTHVI